MPKQTSTKQPQEAPKSDAPAYAVPAGEEHLYHVELSRNVFDPATGKPSFKPFVQKYNVKMWRNIYDTIKMQGYEVNILHDPTKKKK